MARADAYLADSDLAVGREERDGRPKIADAGMASRGRGTGFGLKDIGITLSKVRAAELWGMGILAERDCRVNMSTVLYLPALCERFVYALCVRYEEKG